MSSTIIKISHWSFLDFHIAFSPLPWESIEAQDHEISVQFLFSAATWIWSQSSKKTGFLTWYNWSYVRSQDVPFYLTGNKYFIKLGLEAVVRRCSVTKDTFRNLAKLTGLEACNFVKKETLVQVLSYEFCEIYKNTFCYRTPPVPASVGLW